VVFRQANARVSTHWHEQTKQHFWGLHSAARSRVRLRKHNSTRKKHLSKELRLVSIRMVFPEIWGLGIMVIPLVTSAPRAFL